MRTIPPDVRVRACQTDVRTPESHAAICGVIAAAVERLGAEPTAGAIADLLRAHRIRYTSEKDVQVAIEHLLSAASFPFVREAQLEDAGVIDFIVDEAIGVEVKVAGSTNDVARQLLRYAGEARIRELVLVTTMMRHRALPPTLGGKPVTVVHLIGGAL